MAIVTKLLGYARPPEYAPTHSANVFLATDVTIDPETLEVIRREPESVLVVLIDHEDDNKTTTIKYPVSMASQLGALFTQAAALALEIEAKNPADQEVPW